MLTRLLINLAVSIILISCTSWNKEKNTNSQKDTSKIVHYSDTLKDATRISFKNIQGVIEFAGAGTWSNTKNGLSSCMLYFNSGNAGTDTLDIEYSPECWLSFPYKVVSKKIIVSWDKIIDSKYDFSIVKVINGVEKSYKGRTFMVLELLNDTTLQATYPDSKLINKLNGSAKERILFPREYYFSLKSF